MAFQALGYDSAHHGEGRWNGVAILSRVGLDDVVAGLRRRRRARRRGPAALGHVRRRAGGAASTCRTAASLDDEHYQPASSSGWLACGPASTRCDPCARGGRVRRLQHRPRPTPTCGTPTSSQDATHVSPPERQALAATSLAWGLVDVVPPPAPSDRLFSWWDYRAGMFHKHRGMRIDLVLASRSLADRVEVRHHRPQRPQGQASVRPCARAGRLRAMTEPDHRARPRRRPPRPRRPSPMAVAADPITHRLLAASGLATTPRRGRAAPAGRRRPPGDRPPGRHRCARRRDRRRHRRPRGGGRPVGRLPRRAPSTASPSRPTPAIRRPCSTTARSWAARTPGAADDAATGGRPGGGRGRRSERPTRDHRDACTVATSPARSTSCSGRRSRCRVLRA